jgi:hypothetical protein
MEIEIAAFIFLDCLKKMALISLSMITRESNFDWLVVKVAMLILSAGKKHLWIKKETGLGLAWLGIS